MAKKSNKTGLQPVSRPVEQILGFFPKGFIPRINCYTLSPKKDTHKHLPCRPPTMKSSTEIDA